MLIFEHGPENELLFIAGCVEANSSKYRSVRLGNINGEVTAIGENEALQKDIV